MPTPRGAPGRLPGCSLRHRSPESGSWAALQSGGPKAPHRVTCSPSGSSTPGSLGPAPRPPCPEAGQGRSAAGRGEELELPKSCE